MPEIAKVVVELALDKVFDYKIPEHLRQEVAVGSHVVVPFGRSSARGYVVGFSDRSDFPELKAITERIGKKSLISEPVMELARWMADYYAAPVEWAVRTVLPGAVRRKGAGFKERLMVIPTREARESSQVLKTLKKKAPRQAEVLSIVLASEGMFQHQLLKTAKTTSATVKSLREKGLVTIGHEVERRDPLADMHILKAGALELMPQQQEALTMVTGAMDAERPPVVLLHGVTGSGKTEVYLQAIQHGLDRNQGAIVLVPEISLTPQTVERFVSRFGNIIAVLHSNLSEGERHDEWYRIHEGMARIAIGARSALFAPIHDLGLIVVDEEHEATYKQEEPPRYNARDVAVMRGHIESCAVVLGTATPCLESYYNGIKGKYRVARLSHRVDHQKMPAIRIIDMRVEAQRGKGIPVLSRDLVHAMQDRFIKAEQTILFINRRGFSTSLICPKCGHVVRCGECSVSMTFHKTDQRIKCHLCGRDAAVPASCPNPECGDPAIRYAGMGTQKVEASVAKVLRGAKVFRMDSDTMTRKNSYSRVLGDFRSGKIDVLIGTQMIAKGLHFPNVTLVGVVYADMSLHLPDFRAGERTFQLLTQVAGRAGRGDVMGEVIVQTMTPFHPAIQAARRMDFEGFCDQEIEFRKELNYPPFSHLVCLTVKGSSEERVLFSLQTLHRRLNETLEEEVQCSEPVAAPIARIRGDYRYQIMLRAPRTTQIVRPLKTVLKDFKWPENTTCMVDVDALSLL